MKIKEIVGEDKAILGDKLFHHPKLKKRPRNPKHLQMALTAKLKKGMK